MPFRCKITWEFAGIQTGWTETLYMEPLTATFAEAASAAQAMVPYRAKLLGIQTEIKAVRVQVVQDAAGTKVVRRGDNFQGINKAGSEKPTNDPDVALECDFIDTTLTRHKTMFMRGIWNIITTDYGEYKPTAEWNSAFDAWRIALIGFGFGWLGRTPSAKVNITDVNQTADGFVEITTAGTPFAALPLGVPIQVNVNGVIGQGGLSSINGTPLVKPTANNTCVTVKQQAILPYVSNGQLNTFSQVFIKTGQVSPEKIGDHKTGAPLLQPRGRRRARSKV